MRKPYQLPGWIKNSSYCSAPVELTTFRLHSFIVARVSRTVNHSAMEAVGMWPVVRIAYLVADEIAVSSIVRHQ